VTEVNVKHGGEFITALTLSKWRRHHWICNCFFSCCRVFTI